MILIYLRGKLRCLVVVAIESRDRNIEIVLFRIVIKLFKLFCAASDNLVTDVNIGSLIPLLLKGKGEENEEIYFVTLPGEAVMINGISYYLLNKNSASEVLSKHVKSYNGLFDEDLLYLNNSDEYSKIYYKENLKYEEYNLENIDSLEIKKK